MTKIRRNSPCHCGSGKKFKHCHGSHAAPTPELPPDVAREIDRRIAQVQAAEFQRKQQQGLGKPIVSVEVAGGRIVAVGNRLFHGKWRTFHDFLQIYIIDCLGRDWFKAELSKPSLLKHPIIRWYDQLTEDLRGGVPLSDGLRTGPMTGAVRAYLNLSYNLYLIGHHADPSKVDRLLAGVVKRLKSSKRDDFIGKLFETYAAAAFLKAGAQIEYENEDDGTSQHVEFVAAWPGSQRKYSVEVKSRNRSSEEDGPQDEIRRLRVGNKLNKALGKAVDHERVVLIEVNVPDIVSRFEGWPAAALAQIRDTEKQPFLDGSPKPPAYVFVTNHAFHNNLSAIEGIGLQAMAAGCNIPDFGPDVTISHFAQHLAILERHADMFSLIASMMHHSDIPITFDGENPDLHFGQSKDMPRLQFGTKYAVPKADGSIEEGVLYDAIVSETQKKAIGVYQGIDGHFIATSELTDAELAAWRRHPETFFGERRELSKNASNWLEIAEFMYSSYRDAPKETLLEMMAGSTESDALRDMSQKDLAIEFCDRAAKSAFLSHQLADKLEKSA